MPSYFLQLLCIFILSFYIIILLYFYKNKFVCRYICSYFSSKSLASRSVNAKSLVLLLSSDPRADKYDKAVGKKDWQTAHVVLEIGIAAGQEELSTALIMAVLTSKVKRCKSGEIPSVQWGPLGPEGLRQNRHGPTVTTP